MVGDGRGSTSGTEEEEGGDDVDDDNGNVPVTNMLLVGPARAAAADPTSAPPSSNALGSISGAVRGYHQQQVMMMINMEYSINPLDMDDNNDDSTQNNMAVDCTVRCSSILPHSCSDPKVRFMLHMRTHKGTAILTPRLALYLIPLLCCISQFCDHANAVQTPRARACYARFAPPVVTGISANFARGISRG